MLRTTEAGNGTNFFFPKEAVVIKQEMVDHFGQTHFYRLQRKEKLFTPSQQEYIQKLFLRKGIKESPVFDEYIEQYEYR